MLITRHTAQTEGSKKQLHSLNIWCYMYAGNKGKIQKGLYVSLYAYFLAYNNI